MKMKRPLKLKRVLAERRSGEEPVKILDNIADLLPKRRKGNQFGGASSADLNCVLFWAIRFADEVEKNRGLLGDDNSLAKEVKKAQEQMVKLLAKILLGISSYEEFLQFLPPLTFFEKMLAGQFP